MAAASNESQGLKIAVAVFVMFTVVLAVTTYFGFSNAAQAEAKQAEAEKQAGDAKRVAGEINNTLTELRKQSGFEKAGEDQAALTEALKKFKAELDTKVAAINNNVKAATKEYKDAGGNAPKVEELTQSADQLTGNFTNEPNRTLTSGLLRMTELLDNQARLTVAYAADNEALRKALEEANRVNNEAKNVVVADRDKTKADLEDVHKTHNDQLTGLRAQLDKLQTDNNTQAQEIAKLKTQLASNAEDFKKRNDELMTNMRYYREQFEKKETVLDKANGHITYVDWTRNEVRTDMTRAKGAKPQMTFSIFDKDAPGLPTDKPKATIELIQVGDRDSIGRIITGFKDSLGRYTRTLDPSNPIRKGDQLYTPAYGQQRFALIGKIDMDRDGKDDREDLKRMIKSSGGIIDYDLPVLGTETGKITPLTSWYIVDERDTLRPATFEARRQSGSEDKAFLDKKTAAIQLARSEGVRPMSIDRILAYLNYHYGAPVAGRVEAIDRGRVDEILHPKGTKGTLPPTTEGAPADEPKKDEKTDEPK